MGKNKKLITIKNWLQNGYNMRKRILIGKYVKVDVLSLMVLQQVLTFSLNFQVINTSLSPSTSHSLFLLLLEWQHNSSPMCGKQPHGLRAEAVAEVGSQSKADMRRRPQRCYQLSPFRGMRGLWAQGRAENGRFPWTETFGFKDFRQEKQVMKKGLTIAWPHQRGSYCLSNWKSGKGGIRHWIKKKTARTEQS